MIFVWTLQDVIGLILLAVFLVCFLFIKVDLWNTNRKAKKAAAIRSMK